MADFPSLDELKQLQAAFPSLGEMKQLSLRAMVAYAARCARRVQPFFTLPDDHPEKLKHVAAVERAIQAAEEFARGNPIADVDYFRAASVGINFARFAPRWADGALVDTAAARYAYLAAEAANYAVRAADGAARAAGSDFGKEVLDFDCYEPFCYPNDWPRGSWEIAIAAWHAWAVAAHWIIPANARAAAVAAWSDFDRLRRLGLGRFPELGAPIDPSEDGPLGPLWPEEKRGAAAHPQEGGSAERNGLEAGRA